MINLLYLEYFKCFEKLSLRLAPLTILSGLNASGKSTILQALILLNQTVRNNEWSKNLLLNGSLINLGTASDVIDKAKGRGEFQIGVEAQSCRCDWRMLAEDREALAVPIESISWEVQGDNEKYSVNRDANSRIRNLLPDEFYTRLPELATSFGKQLYNLSYISAERLGPRETYQVSTLDRTRGVGAQGELAPWFLSQNSDKPVNEKLLHSDESGLTLLLQANAWINSFFPGAGFLVEKVPNANLVTLRIRTSQGGDYHRPQNVGYGITHTLPIIIACLGAGQGDTVLIENPEAHLHPAGQALMGRFLSLVAASGVQIITETHSDHILNGVRRAVKEQEHNHEQTAIYFFNPRTEDDSEAKPQVIEPLIDKKGNLSEWPENFFDQFDKDTEYLAGWGQ